MPEWLLRFEASSDPVLVHVLIRLVAAALFGGAVAGIYRGTRSKVDTTESFIITLVLLAILIAMVTQVIGDNIARAFSLVGALSIVRFRTVVRDTQDTAYVIFAVVIGMAIGAGNMAVALIGLAVVGLAALVMRGRSREPLVAAPEDLPFELTIRLALGADPESLLGPTLDRFQMIRRLMTVGTARQGLAMDVAYRASLGTEAAAAEVVTSLNRLEGVQSVTLQRTIPRDL